MSIFKTPLEALNLVLNHHQDAPPLLLLCKTAREAADLNKRLEPFLLAPCFYFPDWETLPYDRYNAAPNIIGSRLKTLYYQRDSKNGVLVTSVDALLSWLCPQSYLNAQMLLLKQGQTIARDKLIHRLVQAGFAQLSQVNERGQFSVRGAILDIFAPNMPVPVRIDFIDDEIDSLRVFDVKTQLTVAEIPEVALLPSSEVDLSDAGLVCFRQSMRQWLGDKALQHPLYKQFEHKRRLSHTGGIEYFLPLFYDETASYFDYLPANTQIAQADGLLDYVKTRRAFIQRRYERYAGISDNEPLPASTLYLNDEILQTALERYAAYPARKDKFKKALQTYENNETVTQPNRIDWLKTQLAKPDTTVILFAKSQGQRTHLVDKLKPLLPDVHFQLPANTDKLLDLAITATDSGQTITIALGYLPEAFLVTQKQQTKTVLCYPAEWLFNQVGNEEAEEETREGSANMRAIIEDLAEIHIDTPVVHIEHGVGRYAGLERMVINDEESEYITIRYADNGKLFIPITDLDKITRYTGADPDNAPLHNLDGKAWLKAKEKARARIYDTAADLLELYAKRAKSQGLAIKIDNAMQQQFANGFLFEATPDQKKAFAAVYHDLQSAQPMDRIICGDVGFGKTEVALRAAFATAYAGFQVAVLVPTTLLAEQHFENFSERFADFPLKVAGISRFKSKKAQTQILEDLASGNLDVVVGTHRLIQTDLNFKRLGLLIIDEEHKFGVKQKERLKALKTDVNILTLTATPIPRTLSMSLSGLRDLSIISSPPENRQPVETIFSDFDLALIREGIEREMARGGQIYFVHNDIDTMAHIEEVLKSQFPQLRIAYAHGRLPETRLERLMHDFYEHAFDLLLTTTIVESGIDNPNANTIFINRADKFGLAQLHQLRGRVGRSNHQAYAYLLTPAFESMTKDAQKRLQAFASLKGLGAGFMLASQDLEIRGAGELLGDQQSGQIHEIGFSLYNEMLEETIDALRHNREVDFSKKHQVIDVDLGASALIPDDYVADTYQRLVLYKRIAACQTERELDNLQIEMIDRFGLLPESLKTLFAVFEIRLLAKRLGILKLVANAQKITLTLGEKHQLDSEKLIALVQANPLVYQIKPDKLTIKEITETVAARSQFIRQWLNQFTINSGENV